MCQRRSWKTIWFRQLVCLLVVPPAFAGPAAAADDASSAQAAAAAPILAVPAHDLELSVAVTAPASLDLTRQPAWELVEVDSAETVVPVQLAPAIQADGQAGAAGGQLLAVIPARAGATGVRRFQLRPAAGGTPPARFRFPEVHATSLGIWEQDRPVLVYNHGTVVSDKVPAGDRRRRRGCYIHPLWGLHGETLTADFPKDHFHHHGIFWAWPHVGIGPDQFDLWTQRGIRQEFVCWIYRQAGPVAAVLAVENGWFVEQRKVMTERVWIRVDRASGTARSVGLQLVWIPQAEPITLRGAGGKSYGGLTIRFAPAAPEQARITVPGGPAADDLLDTHLPWVDFTSPFDGRPSASGATLLVDPDHPDYPPTWLTRHYGAICVGWPGVEARTFPPGVPFRLAYHVWIHAAEVDRDRLAQVHDGFNAAAKVAWE